MPGGPSGFDGVLETALYHDAGERDAMERFYEDTLALRRVSSWPDGIAYRIGDGVLLVFDRDGLKQRDGPISQHGSTGPGHACLVVGADAYGEWMDRLRAHEVEITHEHEWDSGRRSFYFQDPAGNLLEVADGDLWPR
jgi:catechol 2,3-dioxygenase-like lactoylglutathione lyase family enzyme